jgi:hypothetical protein
MTDNDKEERIITWEQYLDATDTMDTAPSPEWDAEVKRVLQQMREHFEKLPLTPKPQQHTDEEHMANLNAMNDIVCDQDKFIKKLEARIKELEAVVKGMEDDPK